MIYVKRQVVRFLVRAKVRTRYPKLRRGQTLVEYALIIAVICIVAIGVLINLSSELHGIYSEVINSQIAQGKAPGQ